MDLDGSQQDPSTDEFSDAKREAAQKSSTSASLSSHEPKIRCRPASTQITSEKSNGVCFEFLAEGAANAVFQVVPSSSHSGKESFVFEDDQGNILEKEKLAKKVLRMSKGKPKTLQYKEIMEGFETEVKPLFRKTEPSQPGGHNAAIDLMINESFQDFIMEHEGVAIAYEAIKSLIAELQTHCPDNRHIEPHHLEERGILLPDMSSVFGSVTTIEIKPKWLLQSPNAPRDSYLCRTCALQASRQVKKPFKGPWICPLALVAGNKVAVEPYVRHRALRTSKERTSKNILQRPSKDEVEAIVQRAVPYLTTGPGHKILQHIRYLQGQLDPKGVLSCPSAYKEEDRLRLAMTLRDCSLFIRIPWTDRNAPIEAKLGDLDFKSRGKKGDWSKKEEGLLHGGWYMNLEAGMDDCWIAQGWKKYAPHYF